MKRLSKAFFNAAVVLLSDAQRAGMNVYGTISDKDIPPGSTHWFNSSVTAPEVSVQSLGKLLETVEAMEYDDGAFGAIASICISKERDQVRLKASVVRYAPMSEQQMRDLFNTGHRDYLNEWTAK